jgi:glucokinase
MDTFPDSRRPTRPKSNDLALGIDIGGTNTKFGLVDRTGQILVAGRFSTGAFGTDPTPFLTRLGTHLDGILRQAPAHPLGIGISTHGYIDDERRRPLACLSTPALRGVDLRGWAERRFGLPVILNNDLIAHALGEYAFGAGRGSKRFMCLAIGTGLGVGVILHGLPLHLVGGTTGDAGRLILEPGGIPCKYEVGGSAEAMCGVENIERLALKKFGQTVPAYQVIAAARMGNDPIAVEIIEQIGAYLGLALASLVAIFLPDKVALTGGTAEAGSVLLDACRQKFVELTGRYHQVLSELTWGYYGGVEIVRGEKPNESGLLGSVVELFQK